MLAIVKLVVKANVVPVRTLTLKRMLERFDVGRTVLPCLDAGCSASSHVVALDSESIARLWRRFVEVLRASIEELVKLVKEVNEARRREGRGPIRLDVVLESIGDVISYVYRWPLYRSPFKGLAIYTPFVSYLATAFARIVDEDIDLNPDIYSIVYGMLVECKKSAMDAEIREFVEQVFPRDEKLEKLRPAIDSLCRLLDLFEREKLEDLIELLLYTIPADTRPGLNHSSLLLHDSLSSAIAYSFAVEELLHRRLETPPLAIHVLRIASLLHDVGKPLEYERHVERSVEVVRHVLEPLRELENYYAGISSIVDLVAALVEKHHASLEECIEAARGPIAGLVGGDRAGVIAEILCSALRKGDQYASSLDRVVDLVIEAAKCGGGEDEFCRVMGELGVADLAKRLASILAGRLGVSDPVKALEIAYRGARGVDSEKLWRLWSELWGSPATREVLVELSEALAKFVGFRARGRLLEYLEERLGGRRERDVGERVSLVLVDVGGVQASIRETQRLRVLASSSLAIDYVTVYGIYRLLNVAARAFGGTARLSIPPEAVVFAGGGTIHALVPRHIAEKLKDVLSSDAARAKAEALGMLSVAFPSLTFRLAIARLERVYALTVKRAYDALFEEKIVGGGASIGVGLSKFAEPCKWCWKRPAQLVFQGEEVCIPCMLKYITSWLLGFTTRTVWLLDRAWRERSKSRIYSVVCEEIVESVRGRRFEFDPLEKIAEGARGQTIAVLKSDGNVMGVFMSGALTPAAYYEKSVRIDSALKKAISSLYSVIEEVVRGDKVDALPGKRLVYTLYYGYLYAGGDDALMLLSSHIALPAAAMLAYTFSAETGFLASLSVGVAAAHYRQPIWLLLDAVEELLDEAKSVSREASLEALQRMRKCAMGGAVAYDYAGRGMLTATKVRTRLRIRRGRVEEARASLDELFKLFGSPGLLRTLMLVEGVGVQNGVGGEVPETIEGDENAERSLVEVLEAACKGLARQALDYVNRLTANVWLDQALFLVLKYDAETGKGVEKRVAERLSMLGEFVDRTRFGSILEEVYLISMLSGGSG